MPATNTGDPKSATGEPAGRRERILRSAIELFRTHGYGATGIDEIGAAAGITGPGIYRHFASKQDILDEAVAWGTREVLTHSSQILEEDHTPEETLTLLTRSLVDDVLDQPDIVTVLLRERRHLSTRGRRLWDQSLREYQTEWIEVLCTLRPDLDADDARAEVWMALGMALAAAQYETRLRRARVGELLQQMIVGALLGGPS